MTTTLNRMPRSGQARINAKRNQRAEYWRTVKIRVHPDIEQPLREHLHLLGAGARIDGRRLPDYAFAVELDIHIPSAPNEAASAVPGFTSYHEPDGTLMRIELQSIDWFRADGSRIEAEQPVGVAS